MVVLLLSTAMIVDDVGIAVVVVVVLGRAGLATVVPNEKSKCFTINSSPFNKSIILF